MAFSLSKIKVNPIAKPSTHPLGQQLSLRCLKGMILGLLACNFLAFLVLWQPEYLQLGSLQEEKVHWEEVLRVGLTNTRTFIPTMDQLPDMIEQCRDVFVKQDVNVVSLNVERFGERKETGKAASIDYASVRLRLLGQWEGIVTSLKALEEMQGVSIHAQEVLLTENGGEALLQIYFCTGEQV